MLTKQNISVSIQICVTCVIIIVKCEKSFIFSEDIHLITVKVKYFFFKLPIE